LKSYKNIITWLVKILIGAGSFFIIYWRLKDDLTNDKLTQLQSALATFPAFCLLFFCLLLVPVNWGIESYKWKMITKPVEEVSYGTATKAVYSAVCVGNLAPGRATEFLAKILFFQPSNRPTIALLHFVNGMFQLSVTIICGLFALALKYNSGTSLSAAKIILISAFCILLLTVFIIFILRFNALQKWVLGFFKNRIGEETIPYNFSKKSAGRLIVFSIVRYAVFTFQFFLILRLFFQGEFTLSFIASVFVYFLFTTVLPMISVIEPAIRAAIALVVFSGSGMNEVTIVTSAVLLWLVNIALPSVIGYLIILKENFNLSSFKR